MSTYPSPETMSQLEARRLKEFKVEMTVDLPVGVIDCSSLIDLDDGMHCPVELRCNAPLVLRVAGEIVAMASLVNNQGSLSLKIEKSFCFTDTDSD